MSDKSSGTTDMRPHFEDIQAHYDLSDDFFGVFQDPTRKYSSAYFTGPSVTLSEAQIANVDQQAAHRPACAASPSPHSGQRGG